MSIDVGTAVGYLDLDTSKWSSGFAQAQQQLNAMMDSTQAAGTRFQSAGKLMSQAGGILTKTVTLPLAGLGIAAVKSSMNTESSMAKVNSILQLGGKEFNNYKNTIKDGANDIGLAYNSYADAAYDAISSGVKQADVTTFLSGANKLAVGGLTDLTSATNLLTTVQNAYGLGQKDLAHVSDVLIQTQNLGKVTVDELASSMGKIIPTAKGLGVSVDQLGAGYSIMTAKGIAGAEATTYMNSMFNELGKSGTKVDKALKEISGKSFKELMESGKSTGDVLQMLSDYAEKSGLSLTDLFGSSEAGKAALTLLSDGSKEFNDVLAQMEDSAGSTDRAFQQLDNTAQRKLAKSMDTLKNALSDLGDVLIPLAADIADAIAKFAQGVSDMAKANPELVQVGAVIAGVLAALGPLLLFFGSIAGAIGNLMSVFKAMRTGFLILKTLIMDSLIPAFGALWGFMLANPITLVIGAIALLVGAFIYCWNHMDGFKEFWINAWDTIKQWCSDAIQAVKDKFDEWGEKISTFINETIPNFINGIGEWFSQLPERIGQWLTTTIDNISTWCSDTLNTFINWCSNVITNIGQWFAQLPYNIGFALGTALGNIAKWIADTWNYFSTNIPKWIESISNWFKELPGKVWQWLVSTYQKTVEWGSQMLQKAVEVGTNFLNKIVQFFTQLPGKIWNFLSQAYQKAVAWASQMIAKALEAGSQFINKVSSFMQQLPGQVWNFLSQAISKAASFVTQFAQKATEAAQRFASNIKNGLSSIPGQVISIGTNIVQGLWNGISGAAGWLYGKVASFAKGILDGMKSALGIHSPSRVMRDIVGVNIVKGIGVGIDKEMPSLRRSISKNVADINSDVADVVSNSNETINQEYSTGTQKINTTVEAMWKRNKDIWLKGISDVDKLEQDHNNKLKEIADDRDKSILEATKKYENAKKKIESENAKTKKAKIAAAKKLVEEEKKLQDAKLKAIDSYNDKLEKININYKESKDKLDQDNLKDSKDYYLKMEQIQKEYAEKTDELSKKFKDEQQKLTDEYSKIFEDRTKSLMGWTNIFSEVKENEKAASASKLTSNLEDQVETFEKWSNSMASLKQRVGNDLYKELLEQGPKAFQEIEAINSMADEELKKYEELYRKKKELAEKQSLIDTKVDKDRIDKQLQDLKTKYETDYQELATKLSEDVEKQLSTVKEKFGAIPSEMMKTGTDTINNLIEGINSKRNELYTVVNSVGQEVANRLASDKLNNVLEDNKSKQTKVTDISSKDLEDFMKDCEGVVKKYTEVMDTVNLKLGIFLTNMHDSLTSISNASIEVIKFMCSVMIVDLNGLTNSAISAWDRIRQAYARDITGVIRVKTLLQDESVTNKSTYRRDANRSLMDTADMYSSLRSLAYSDDLAKSVNGKNDTGNNIKINIDYDKLAKAVANNSKPNLKIENTYNSPKPASIIELKRQDEIQMRRLGMELGF